MIHTVARHLGVSDEEPERAVTLAVEQRRLQTDGTHLPRAWPCFEGSNNLLASTAGGIRQ
jgi:hypothetical protein